MPTAEVKAMPTLPMECVDSGRSAPKPSAPSSHVEALKSSSIIGGSTVIVMLIRMVRTKVLALLLGPAGIGLEALYDSAVNLCRTFFDFGITSSGVRQIAAAVGTGSDEVIARTTLTLRRVCLVLGVAGAATVFLARESISLATFGKADHAADIGVLSIILLFGAVVGGQGAMLQGMRRIADLAKVNIFGALAGAAASIPIVWVWGLAGIPAYMVITAGVGALVSWVYARRVHIRAVTVSLRQSYEEASSLLRLGVAFLASSLMATGTLFLLRVMATRMEGVIGAGQFQAASALSMVYVGFILQAMGTDFYPRLTAVASDNQRCNQLVNEQAEISLLLALPGILGTLALAPWVILLFYSSKFDQAATILSWQVAGMCLRVISWPMGFILVAKGRGTLFVLTDAAAWTVYLGLAWLGLKWFGLPGMGMAFLALYVFHVILVYVVVHSVSGFRWAQVNVRLGAASMLAIAAALASRLLLPEPWGSLIGCLLALAAGLFCLRALVRIAGPERINRVLNKFHIPLSLPVPPGT